MLEQMRKMLHVTITQDTIFIDTHDYIIFFFLCLFFFLMNDNSLFRERGRGLGSSLSFETKTQEGREEMVRSSSQMQKLAQRTRLLVKTITCLGIKTKSQQTFRVFCTLYVNVNQTY
jgi:hypothetical protein